MTLKSTPEAEWVPNADPDKPDLLGHYAVGDFKFPLWIGETSARGLREALAEEARVRERFRKKPPQPPSPPRPPSFTQVQPHFSEPGDYEVWLLWGGERDHPSGGFFVAPLGRAPALARHAANVAPGAYPYAGMVRSLRDAILSVPPNSALTIRCPYSSVEAYLADNATKLLSADAGRCPDGSKIQKWDWWCEVHDAIRSRPGLTITAVHWNIAHEGYSDWRDGGAYPMVYDTIRSDMRAKLREPGHDARSAPRMAPAPKSAESTTPKSAELWGKVLLAAAQMWSRDNDSEEAQAQLKTAEARGGEAASTAERKLLLRFLDAARLAVADRA